MKYANMGWWTTLSLLAVLSCTAPEKNNPIEISTLIDSDNIENHIKILASDEYLGRKPGTEGEQKTISYIQNEFKAHNILPANGDSYLQAFKITEIKPIPPKELIVRGKSGENIFKVKEDFIAKTNHYNKPITIENKELVFAGFGIVAPEFGRDDYAGLDVKDKIVVVLFSDPGLYDSTKFNGPKGTTYGSSNTKKNEAYKRGAAGLLTIFHDTGPTGMNWPLVKILATRPTYFLEGKQPPIENEIGFTGMLSIATAQKLMELSGRSKDYIKLALADGFTGFNMGLSASLTVESALRTFETHNVIGYIRGEKYPDECIIYTAHWDHDGIAENPVNGDSILNGAIDNASGTAMVIETARTFASLNHKPDRSIVFFLTSAEEMGLLGSNYYANNPLFPLSKTVCVINTDAAHATEPMRLAVNVLQGHSEMDTVVLSAAAELGRKIIPDPTPQIGAFYRSDHFPLVEKGIPAVWAVGGAEPMQGDSARAMQLVHEYGATKYHQVTDEYYDGFLMGNIRLDAQLNFLIGYRMAMDTRWPNWYDSSPYKKLRDSLLNIQ